MKRWIILGFAAATVAAVAVWIVRNTTWDYTSVPGPLKGEAVTNPFYARQRFVDALGGQAERRLVLGTLPDNAVLMLSYWHWSLIESRRRELEKWVEAGGRLVVGPTLIGGAEELERWSGIAREDPDDEEEDEEGEPEEAVLEDTSSLTDSTDSAFCSTLEVETTDLPAAREEYHVCRLSVGTWLTSRNKPSWSLIDADGQLQALRVSVGRGSVTMVNASPFGNRDLTKFDHGALFVAAAQLRRGDHAVFLSEEERSSLLSLMWTYGSPAVVLALILLAITLWRYGVRFGPLSAPPDSSRRSIAEQIRGTGQFIARCGNQALHAAMVRALNETASRHIARYARLPQDERIRAIARLAGTESDALEALVNYRGPRRAGDLRNAIMVLELTRRHILEADEKKRGRHAS
jgi:hypothetical protein